MDRYRKSILTRNMENCLICGTNKNIHIHHAISGRGRRQLSEKYRLLAPLCGQHHNLGDYSAHLNAVLNNRIRAHAQRAFEIYYPDLDFIKIFGESFKEE